MKVVNLRPRGSDHPGTPIAESRAAEMIKSGRWELAPGAPQLPIGCPAELAQREQRQAAERAAEKAASEKADAATREKKPVFQPVKPPPRLAEDEE